VIDALAFHVSARDAQLRGLEIDVRPFELSQLERTQEYQRLEPQCATCNESPRVAVDVEQEFPDLSGIGEARVMLDLRGVEQTAQVGLRSRTLWPRPIAWRNTFPHRCFVRRAVSFIPLASIFFSSTSSSEAVT
jgi:hypothetical protein